MNGSDAQTLINVVLSHNSLVAQKLSAAIGDVRPASWAALGEALGNGDAIENLLTGFAGNPSERLVLAALLSKAGYAGLADKLCPKFFDAWGGLDPFNRGLVADILADEG